MTGNDKKQEFTAASAGPWIAMAAAVILTAKGEFDLAVLAHFAPEIAWMFPVMIDVYVVTSFHRKRRPDMVIGMLLMIFCQIAVHLLPVYITEAEGEVTPWGLVVAVACIAPVVVVRVKILTGRTAKEIAAEQEATQRADEVRAAQAETTAARRALAEIKAAAAVAAEQAQVEIAAREAAQTRAVEAETRAEIAGRERAEVEIAARAEVESLTAQATAQVEIEAGKQEEIGRRAQEEIGRLQTAVRDAIEARDAALRYADEQTQAAGLAQGRLAEARDSADRAAAAKTAAELRAQAHMELVSAAAEQAEHQVRQQLAAATGAAASAERSVAELAERVRTVQAQREEARAAAERAGNRAALAERQIADLERGRDAAFDELEKVRRQLARATEKAEIVVSRQVEISTSGAVEISSRPERKSALPVPVRLPENLPVVDSVRPEKVATVLIAKAIYREATYAELADASAVSTRTVGTVLRTVPKEIAEEVGEQLLALVGGGQVLALTDGRAA